MLPFPTSAKIQVGSSGIPTIWQIGDSTDNAYPLNGYIDSFNITMISQ